MFRSGDASADIHKFNQLKVMSLYVVCVVYHVNVRDVFVSRSRCGFLELDFVYAFQMCT